jgi:Na+/H+-dicarboxylate symporter
MEEGTEEKKVHGFGLLNREHIKELNSRIKLLIKRKLWVQILVALFAGIAVGILLNPSQGLLSEPTSLIVGEWFALPGNLFLAIIQMVVIPLVMVSIILSIAANKSVEHIRKNGIGLVIFLIGIAVIAVIIGIVVGKVIQPGNYIDPGLISHNQTDVSFEQDSGEISLRTIPSNIVSLFPQNIIGSIFKSQMLQLVIFSFIFGFALLSLTGKTGRPLIDLFQSIQSVSMEIVKWVMLIAPLAVFGLIAQLMIKTGLEVLIGLGVYILTVLFGLAILMVFFMLLVFFVGRRNPFVFLYNIKDPLLLAFSTDSSAATMPLSLKTAREKLKVSRSVSQFVIPIGATINMSGTALYQGLATMFMAQLFGIELPLAVLISLIVTSVGASIGAPATPGVGIVVLSSVLVSAGIPLAGIPLILGVDRILEMSRAVLNVAGDLVACVILDRYN